MVESTFCPLYLAIISITLLHAAPLSLSLSFYFFRKVYNSLLLAYDKPDEFGRVFDDNVSDCD